MIDINKLMKDQRPHFLKLNDADKVAMVVDDPDKFTTDLAEQAEYQTAYGAFSALKRLFKDGYTARYSTETFGIGHLGKN